MVVREIRQDSRAVQQQKQTSRNAEAAKHQEQAPMGVRFFPQNPISTVPLEEDRDFLPLRRGAEKTGKPPGFLISPALVGKAERGLCG